MADENAKIDENKERTLLGVTDDASEEIRRLLVDAATGRLKVSAVLSGGVITDINSDSTASQTLTVGTTGTDFAIVDDASGDHKFNLPDASTTNRGALTSTDWDTFTAKQDSLTFGIANTNSVVIDSASVASGEYAKFTASGLESKSFAEVKADLNLEIGTDVLAQQTIGIADNNLVETDSATVASGETARFTANGLESRSNAEMKTQLGYMTDLVDDTTPQLGGDLDLNSKNIDFPTTANISDCLDEDTMSSNSATKLATQQSIKAYVDNLIAAIYPVGHIWISTVSTNPNTVLGFGTWATFGAGKTLVSLDSGDADFDTSEETRGSKTHTLSAAESGVPVHSHTGSSGNQSASHTHSGTTATQSADHNHGASLSFVGSGGDTQLVSGNNARSYTNDNSVGHTHTVTTGNQSASHTHTVTVNNNSAAAASAAHNNIQPSIVVYMFKRTA